MDALAANHGAAVQMIDTSVVRVHQHGACIADNNQQDLGRSRGGLTSKIHVVVETNGLPVHLALTPREGADRTFFNKIKQCRRVAARYNKLAANYLAFVKLASIRNWLRANESAPYRAHHQAYTTRRALSGKQLDQS
jgi:hypothetical protein